MKSTFAALFASILLLAAGAAAQKGTAYTGEIMDSQCALLGGHQNMIKQGENPKDCTDRCVKIGGKYTLFDAAKKMAYQLDDQKKAQEFAGAKVTVTGTLDAATKTIHVTKIAKAKA